MVTVAKDYCFNFYISQSTGTANSYEHDKNGEKMWKAHLKENGSGGSYTRFLLNSTCLFLFECLPNYWKSFTLVIILV